MLICLEHLKFVLSLELFLWVVDLIILYVPHKYFVRSILNSHFPHSTPPIHRHTHTNTATRQKKHPTEIIVTTPQTWHFLWMANISTPFSCNFTLTHTHKHYILIKWHRKPITLTFDAFQHSIHIQYNIVLSTISTHSRFQFTK